MREDSIVCGLGAGESFYNFSILFFACEEAPRENSFQALSIFVDVATLLKKFKSFILILSANLGSSISTICIIDKKKKGWYIFTYNHFLFIFKFFTILLIFLLTVFKTL